jgi:hypothetical protein
MIFGYSDTVDIFVNSQKVFQGNATCNSRDIQCLRALWLRA